jgi:hypothetical protein
MFRFNETIAALRQFQEAKSTNAKSSIRVPHYYFFPYDRSISPFLGGIVPVQYQSENKIRHDVHDVPRETKTNDPKILFIKE